MLLRVNKNTGSRKTPVQYAALSTGTISHVWYDEDSASSATPKRQNRIKLIRAQNGVVLQDTNHPDGESFFDA